MKAILTGYLAHNSPRVFTIVIRFFPPGANMIGFEGEIIHIRKGGASVYVQ
jgi:hypothetical protein